MNPYPGLYFKIRTVVSAGLSPGSSKKRYYSLYLIFVHYGTLPQNLGMGKLHQKVCTSTPPPVVAVVTSMSYAAHRTPSGGPRGGGGHKSGRLDQSQQSFQDSAWCDHNNSDNDNGNYSIFW